MFHITHPLLLYFVSHTALYTSQKHDMICEGIFPDTSSNDFYNIFTFNPILDMAVVLQVVNLPRNLDRVVAMMLNLQIYF